MPGSERVSSSSCCLSALDKTYLWSIAVVQLFLTPKEGPGLRLSTARAETDAGEGHAGEGHAGDQAEERDENDGSLHFAAGLCSKWFEDDAKLLADMLKEKSRLGIEEVEPATRER